MLTFFIVAIPLSEPSLPFFSSLPSFFPPFPIPGMTHPGWVPILPSCPSPPLLPQVSGLGAGGSPSGAAPSLLPPSAVPERPGSPSFPAHILLLRLDDGAGPDQPRACGAIAGPNLTIRSLLPAAAFKPAKPEQSWGFSMCQALPGCKLSSSSFASDVQIKSQNMGPLRREGSAGLPPSFPQGWGGSLWKQDLHSRGGTGVDKECLCGCKSPLGSGLPSLQLARPAEQHVHVGRNFPFLPLKMRRGEKKKKIKGKRMKSFPLSSLQCKAPAISKEQVANSSASVGSDLGSVLKAG